MSVFVSVCHDLRLRFVDSRLCLSLFVDLEIYGARKLRVGKRDRRGVFWSFGILMPAFSSVTFSRFLSAQMLEVHS